MHLWARNADDPTRRLRLRRRSRCSQWSRSWAGSAAGLSAWAPSAPAASPDTVSCVTSRLASLGGGHGNATAREQHRGRRRYRRQRRTTREGAPTR
jgi:acyl-coenzyme A thioesterase PaaI-like protein